MALILRVDVDKPYGRNSFVEKILSKAREDYWFPKIDLFGYLKATEEFIKFCNANGVKGFFYFRNCTVPNKKVIALLKEGNHKVGFHAENTRSLETFEKELALFRSRINGLEVTSFTKHGSGDIKIGRHHYAPYEEANYRDWANQLKIKFPFGNAICEAKVDFDDVRKFYPKMFWIHHDYRHESMKTIENALEIAAESTITIIIHPSNFIAEPFVRSEFQRIVKLSNEQSIPWIVKDIIEGF